MAGEWPALPDRWGSVREKYRELVLAAQIELAKTAVGSKAAPPKSLADDDSEKKLHEHLAGLVKASIDRAREGAKFVETAAAGLGTIYTGIAAFAFAAANTPLPGRGIYAAVFLGIAVVAAAFYLAFIDSIDPIGRVEYRGSRAEDQWRRTEYLGAWTRAVVRRRAWALRTAVFALAFGVIFMPFAFLPTKLPSNPLALMSVTEPTDPAPAASPTWPPAPSGIPEPEIASVLYKAQLDEFVKSKASSPSSTSPSGDSTEGVAMRLFVIGLATLLVVAVWDRLIAVWRWFWAPRREKPPAQSVRART
jgi:hypothetical protein